MSSHNHVFHTKHDFTPQFAWSAFQLLTELPIEGVTAPELLEIAKILASPLAKRAELSKLLSAFQELGLVERSGSRIALSQSARALAENLAHYEYGFYAAMHCIYVWKWLWDGNTKIASPSWSYREVCRQTFDSAAIGITANEIVLRIVAAANEQFDTDKVSFSRSSVSGVTVWLETQTPPLIKKDNQYLRRQDTFVPTVETLRLHLSAICALGKGVVELNATNVRLLAESLLVSEEEIQLAILDFANDSSEFMLTESALRAIIFRYSNEPFTNWIMNHCV